MGVVLAVAFLAGERDAPGGVIFGHVEVLASLSSPRSRPSTRDPAPSPPAGVPNRSQSVVYLKTAPQGAFEDSPRKRATLDQREETFVPYVVPVTIGTIVDFPNSDPFFHNVFSLSKPRRFDLGRYPKGETKSIRFDTPGVVRVFCEIHSHMSAFVLVFAHRYFALTDASGNYHIDGVPPGTYDVVVWTDGKERAIESVTVPSGGRVAQDFTVE